MRMQLLIKGHMRDAVEALAAHGMTLASEIEQLDEKSDQASVSVVVADVTDDRLIVWYLEPPEHPPFPPGTLLYYGPAPGEPV